MKTTFTELGIPFPLYEAPVRAEGDPSFVRSGMCCVCDVREQICFHLGIGDAIVLPCPGCETINGLDVSDQATIDCRNCGTSIEFPERVANKKEPKVCYPCLRAGKAALTKETEFGMISWEQAFAGHTHGVPGLKQDQFETVVIDADEDWYGVKLPQEMMFELLRTPTYDTWQGERWLFCCRYPMTFVGEWQREDFDQRATDGDGEKLYNSVVEEFYTGTWDVLGQRLSVYVFECKQCGRLRSHCDSD